MGMSSPSVSDPPVTPELKKSTDSDIQQARNETRAAAIARFGLAGTDVTKATLTEDASTTKKKTLGG